MPSPIPRLKTRKQPATTTDTTDANTTDHEATPGDDSTNGTTVFTHTSTTDEQPAYEDKMPSTDTSTLRDPGDSDDGISRNADPGSDGMAVLEGDAVNDPGLPGNRLYYAIVRTYHQPLGQGINVGNDTSYTFTGLDGGPRY